MLNSQMGIRRCILKIGVMVVGKITIDISLSRVIDVQGYHLWECTGGELAYKKRIKANDALTVVVA